MTFCVKALRFLLDHMRPNRKCVFVVILHNAFADNKRFRAGICKL